MFADYEPRLTLTRIFTAVITVFWLEAIPIVAASQEASGNPITLRQVLDSVHAQYPLVAAALARARAARGTRITAGAIGNPTLAYQVDDTPFPGGSRLQLDREAMTMVTLPLEPLYQRGARVRRADADLAMAEAEARSTGQTIALEAARAFYRVGLAQITVGAERELAAWLDSLVVYNRTRAKEGVAAESDAIRSELERDRALADLSINEAELARADAELAQFVGNHDDHRPRRFVVIPEDPLVTPQASTPTSSLVSSALAKRPSVAAAERRVAAATAGISVEKAMLFRQLGATFGVKNSGGVNSMIAGLSLPVPLFDRNRGEVTRASAERDATAFELEAERLAVRADVIGSAQAARIIAERVASLRGGYLVRADEARRIALGAYREGAVPLLQVLDAARAWSEARVTYYRLLIAQDQSVVELNAAMGIDLLSTVPESR